MIPITPIPTDTELVLHVQNELLKKLLLEVRELLQIPDRPAQIDDLYHAQTVGTLKGRMQMALNAIDSATVNQEVNQ